MDEGNCVEEVATEATEENAESGLTLRNSLNKFKLDRVLANLDNHLEDVRKYKKTSEDHKLYFNDINKEMIKLSRRHHPDRVKNEGGSDEELERAKNAQAALNSTRTFLIRLNEEFLKNLDIDYRYEFYADVDINSVGTDEEFDRLNMSVQYKIIMLSEIKNENIIPNIKEFLNASSEALDDFIKNQRKDFGKHFYDARSSLNRCIKGYEKITVEFRDIEKTLDEEEKNLSTIIRKIAAENKCHLEILQSLGKKVDRCLAGRFEVYTDMVPIDSYFVLPFVKYVNALLMCNVMFDNTKDIPLTWEQVKLYFRSENTPDIRQLGKKFEYAYLLVSEYNPSKYKKIIQLLQSMKSSIRIPYYNNQIDWKIVNFGNPDGGVLTERAEEIENETYVEGNECISEGQMLSQNTGSSIEASCSNEVVFCENSKKKNDPTYNFYNIVKKEVQQPSCESENGKGRLNEEKEEIKEQFRRLIKDIQEELKEEFNPDHYIAFKVNNHISEECTKILSDTSEFLQKEKERIQRISIDIEERDNKRRKINDEFHKREKELEEYSRKLEETLKKSGIRDTINAEISRNKQENKKMKDEFENFKEMFAAQKLQEMEKEKNKKHLQIIPGKEENRNRVELNSCREMYGEAINRNKEENEKMRDELRNFKEMFVTQKPQGMEKEKNEKHLKIVPDNEEKGNRVELNRRTEMFAEAIFCDKEETKYCFENGYDSKEMYKAEVKDNNTDNGEVNKDTLQHKRSSWKNMSIAELEEAKKRAKELNDLSAEDIFADMRNFRERMRVPLSGDDFSFEY